MEQKKMRYNINGHLYNCEGKELLSLASDHLHSAGELNIKKEEGAADLYALLEKIQQASWHAQAYISGILAVAGRMMEGIEEDMLSDEHTLQHIAWLHIAVRNEILDEIQNAIEDAESLESEANRAKKAKENGQGAAA